MSNFEHAKYDANGVRIDDPSFNTQALREAKGELVKGIGWVKRAKGDKLPKIVQE